MIFQTSSEWILGVSIMFGIAFILTAITYTDLETFFIFLTIISGFIVWAGLLPLWTLILNLIILTVLISNKTYKRRKI